MTRFRYSCVSVCLLGLLGFFGCGQNSGSVDSKRAQLFPNPPGEDTTPAKPLNADSDLIAAGTSIEVETLETVDSETTPSGGFIPVLVIADVKGRDGKVAIPQNTSGVLIVRTASRKEGNSDLDVALYQLTMGDKSYLISNGGVNLATLQFREEAYKGAAHRSVHLGKRTPLKFAVSQGFQFKR